MLKEFDKFMSQLKETNQTLDFFCDFGKISQNVEDIKLSLCMLNSLIGASDLRKSVETIWNRDKNAFSVMKILIAVRARDKKKILDSVGNCVPLENMFNSVDSIMTFLSDTGLGAVLQNQQVKNLVDYVFGIETGLDTNARKNRSGHVMESMLPTFSPTPASLSDKKYIRENGLLLQKYWEMMKSVLTLLLKHHQKSI